MRRKHRSILGVRNICDASAPLLLRARKCVALHASAQMPMSTGEACSFVDFRLPHAKISGPQGGVKHLLFGCERPKSECFNVPRMGTEHAFTSQSQVETTLEDGAPPWTNIVSQQCTERCQRLSLKSGGLSHRRRGACSCCPHIHIYRRRGAHVGRDGGRFLTIAHPHGTLERKMTELRWPTLALGDNKVQGSWFRV